MDLNAVHSILFNAHILYSLALGVWAAMMAARNEPISGNFWGAVATYSILGIIMMLSGLRPPRLTLYLLYMAWLVIIMPGLFTLLRGRDDRSAAVAFSILGIFNSLTSASMAQRMVTGPWVMEG
jgi:hypothetical protein